MHNRNLQSVEYGFRSLEKLGMRYISRRHPEFPYLLAQIPDPPAGIFFCGKIPDEKTPTVAMVGSRRCTDYGLSIARRFGAELAENGVAVVSGMARGIDSMAHQGALSARGETVAVLGCGPDICYPPENTALRDDIIRSGCVVSEYPPGVLPAPHHFPARNRIISGFSQVVVVVEAGKRSGTLITVEQALDQGREVMAVPGNIFGKYSEGTNALIKQGAEPASGCADILHILESVSDIRERRPKPAETKPAPVLPEGEQALFGLLSAQPVPFDDIVMQTGNPPQSVQYILTMLELKGLVQKFPGMKYSRKK